MVDYGHRSNQSLSLPPGAMPPQRRMTSPATSQTSLSLPDGGRGSSPRPSSPLRHEFTYDSSTGVDHDQSFASDDDDHPNNWKRSPSPSSSVSNLAHNFVQRVNMLVGRSGVNLPTDAELEAEAERERERSRREAEAILTREAQQRNKVEERVMAMLDSSRSLPPPPHNPPKTPSPAPSSTKEGGPAWWNAAKNKLTPTKEKEPVTPAQQVILDAKSRDSVKGKGKREGDGAANLNIPSRKPVPSSPSPSPSSPTPSRANMSVPQLTPSPMRGTDSLTSSPSREAPPLYAQFNPQGALDVPTTLLAIARRFEKLEKWTIGHVRALEDRMNDVERWLVDKEKDKEKGTDTTIQKDLGEIREEMAELQGRFGELGREMAKMATAPSNLSAGPKSQNVQNVMALAPRQASETVSLLETRGEVDMAPAPPPVKTHSRSQSIHSSATVATEGRSGELNREWTMTPSRTHPRSQSAVTGPLPDFTPILLPDFTGNSAMSATPRRLSALDSTSPPLAHNNRTPSGTKLPYPTGDYNAPDTFSPPSSPPASLNASILRKPSVPFGSPKTTSSPSSKPLRTESPSNSGLPPPKPKANFRQSSVSPTPRKRYTVALGEPITAPPEMQSNVAATIQRVGTPKSFTRELDDEDDEDDGGETIGKSASARVTKTLTKKRSTTSLNSQNSDKDDAVVARHRGRGDYKPPASATVPAPAPIDPSPMSNRRLRSQSAYGYSAVQAQSAQFSDYSNNLSSSGSTSIGTTAPLRFKARPRSSERMEDGYKSDGAGLTTATGGKFVDPLVLRRQESAGFAKPIAMPRPLSKGSIGQLVAFFDKDKPGRR